MRIREITEILLQMRKDYSFTSNEEEVICAVCNLPTTMEEATAKERMKTV